MKLSEPIRDSEAAVALLRKAIPRGRIRLQECMVALALDAQFRVIGKPILVAMGTANNVAIHMRDVFREAIRRNAIGVIVAHNHPSGDLEPSVPDVMLAQKTEAVGTVLGIQVLDNIVVSADGYKSKTDGGWGNT